MRRFPRTAFALDGERPGVSVSRLLIAVVLLGGWFAWLFLARISLCEVTPLGRLSVVEASYPIVAQSGGRVVSVPMTLGREVTTGELLVQLDPSDLEMRQGEISARLEALERESASARRELALRRRALAEQRHALALAGEQARSRLEEAELEARFAAEEAERASVLEVEGQLARVEAERLRFQAGRRRVAVESFRLAVARQESAARASALVGETELAEIAGTVARLEGETQATQAAIAELRHQGGKLSIRAPSAGWIGDTIDLPIAALVRAGEQLGTVVAEGEVAVVADFAAASALGRLTPGLSARVRLDGFSWLQYGMLAATVERVASVPRTGRVRVELSVDGSTAPRIPLQHGLTGSVEVEVERLSPAGLLLRALGKRLVAAGD